VIRSFLPELGGYAGKFAGKMIEGLAERLYGPLVEHLFRRDATFSTNVTALSLAAGATKHFDSTTLSSVINSAEPEADKRIAAKSEVDERMRRREQELGIPESEFDERLVEIHDYVKKYPDLTEDQFQDVLAYAQAVRSGKPPRGADPLRFERDAHSWKWVPQAIAREKVQALGETGSDMHDIDPIHRVEPRDVHPDFHPIP
jgi:hypothetical protein